MNIAVCDDNNDYVGMMSNFLRSYFFNKSLSVNIYHFYDGDSLLDDVENGVSFDAVFLGVERAGRIGIETAYRLREINFVNKIILVSSTVAFAVKGYEVGASGYLLKSWRTELVKNVLDRVSNTLEVPEYLIKQRSNIIKVKLKDIVYIESNNSKCTVHTVNGSEYVLYKRLSDIEAELSDESFLRCHRSFLVNMNYIESVDKEFVLKNGGRVMIRQKSLKEMRSRFLDFATQRNGLYI